MSALRPAPKATGWRRIFSNDVYKVHHLSFHSSFGVADEDVAAITRLPWLRRLSLHRTSVTDKSAVLVSKLKHLEALSFQGTQLTDEGLGELSKLKKLKSLSLKSTAITDAGLEQLSDLTEMEVLMLQNTHITTLRPIRKMTKLIRLETGTGIRDPESLQYLSDMSQLEKLWLDYMPLSKNDLEQLGSLPTLRDLSIASAQFRSAPEEAWQRLPNLERLTTNCLGHFSMAHHQRISTLTIRGMPSSIRLENLPKLSEANITYNNLQELVVRNCDNLTALMAYAKDLRLTGLPNLQILRIGPHDSIELQPLPSLTGLYLNQHHIQRDLLQILAKSKKVRFVELANQTIEAGSLELLKEFPELETLDLRWHIWDSDEANLLPELPKLRNLRIKSGNVTAEFVQQVAKAPQIERVEVYAPHLSAANCEVLLQAPNLKLLILTCRGKNRWGEYHRYELRDPIPNKPKITVNGRTFVRTH